MQMASLGGNLYRPLLITLTLCWVSCGGGARHDSKGAAGDAGIGGSGAGHAGSAGSSGEAGGSAGAVDHAAGAAGEAGAAGAPPCTYFEGDESGGPGCWAMCGTDQVDFWYDWTNCGGCHHHCKTGEKCDEGTCVVEECLPGTGSCARPGCESSLSTPDNCGACGVVAAPPAEHAVALCGCAGACEHGMCAPGYANCDQSSSDCETSLATGGACVPKPTWFCTPGSALFGSAVAIAQDGTLFVSGWFQGDTDFDPSSGVDLRTSVGTYLSKFNPDGSYAWTRTWSSLYEIGAFFIHGLRPGPDGSVAAYGEVVAGGAVTKVDFDLDPGPDVDLHPASTGLVRFDANGSYLWGRSWGGESLLTIADVAFDDLGRVYVAGQFMGRMDADPGPGSTRRGIGGYNYADLLLSLDESGNYRWSLSFTDARCTSGLGALVVKGNWLWTGGFVSNCAGKTNPVVELPSLSKHFGVDPATPFLMKTDLAGNVDRALPFSNEFNARVDGIAIDSANHVYIGIGQSGAVDFDPGPGVESRTGPGSVVSLSEDWAYRWVVSGLVGGGLSLLPGEQILAATSGWNSSGNPIFSLDPSEWANQRMLTSSSVAGLAILGVNKTNCPNGLEVQRYTW